MKDNTFITGGEYEADFIGTNSQGWNKAAFKRFVDSGNQVAANRMKDDFAVKNNIATIEEWHGSRQESRDERKSRQRLMLMKWFIDHQPKERNPFNPSDKEEAQTLYLETVSAMEELLGKDNDLADELGLYSSLHSILDSAYQTDCFMECKGAFQPIDITKNPNKNNDGEVLVIQAEELEHMDVIKMKALDIAHHLIAQIQGQGKFEQQAA